MFRHSRNKVIVKLEQKYARNITALVKEAHIQNLSSIDPADFVEIVGEVVSVPLEISEREDYRGFTFDDILPGDTAIFSTSVVAERHIPEGDKDPIFTNSFWYKNGEYFLCDIQYLYAVIRDGKIRMQNGYVMLEKLDKQPQLYLPQHLRKKINTVCGVVSHIGKNLSHLPRINAEVGDTVYFNPNHVQIHQINGKPFGIITQKQILGRKTATYEELVSL